MHQYAVKHSVCSNGALLSHQRKGEFLSQRHLLSPTPPFRTVAIQVHSKWPIIQPTGAPETLTYPILSADVSNTTHPHRPFKQHIPTVSHGRRRPTAVQAESCLHQQLLCWLCWSDGRVLINFTCRQASTHHYCRPSTHHFTLRRLYLGNFARSLVRFFI